MRNIFFDDEIVTENDLYFICYMIEKVSRHLHQRNQYCSAGGVETIDLSFRRAALRESG